MLIGAYQYLLNQIFITGLELKNTKLLFKIVLLIFFASTFAVAQTED